MSENSSSKEKGLPEARRQLARKQLLEQTLADYRDYNDKRINFIKWVVLTSLGFITVFTSLNQKIPKDPPLQTLYGCIIVSVSLAIFLSGIAVYGNLQKDYFKILKKVDSTDISLDSLLLLIHFSFNSL